MNESGLSHAAGTPHRDESQHIHKRTTREMIYRNAFMLFAKRGYNKTTMSDIAKACNTTKTLVQYHAPKKELLANLLMRSLFELIESAMSGATMPRKIDSLEQLYVIGFLHFNLLTQNVSMEPITKDIVASRKLTERMIDTEIMWIARTSVQARHRELSGETSVPIAMWSSFVNDQDTLEPHIEQAVVAGQGGAYELMHHEYLHHRSPDPGALTDLSYAIFTGLSGEDHSEAMHGLPALHELRSSTAVRAINNEAQSMLTALLSG
ncbi:TetR/AcrR family transcriptional regulator [Bifidobacterium aquikefiri]|uniref:TetR/AcrR family transcriptional regulator n=1 Tax=Bifidobacterium aquikefiri TaxID=1653207 RepID=UPI0039EA17C6